MKYNPDYFKKTRFSKSDVMAFIEKSKRDLEIARKDKFCEVKFTFAYQALLKISIAVIARDGYRLRSVPGHHIKAIEALSDFLNDPTVFELGNTMRMKRNTSLYGIEEILTDKAADDFIKYVVETTDRCIERLKRGRKANEA